MLLNPTIDIDTKLNYCRFANLTDKLVIMIKMVKVLTVALVLQGGNVLNAQEASNTNSVLEKFSLTPQIGLLHSWGDFKKDGLGGFLENNEMGLNLLLNYKLNKVITLSAGGLYGKLTGANDIVKTSGAINAQRDLGLGIQFNTDLFELTIPRVEFNLTRLLFKDNSKLFNKFSVSLIGSQGLVFSNSKIYAQQDEGVNLIYSKDRGVSENNITAVTSYGLGLSYIINDRFDIGVESTIRNAWNDVLDAWISDESANDKYSFTAIGITYHLKKRSEVRPTENYLPNKLANKEIEVTKEEVVEEVKEEVVAVEEVVEEIKEEVIVVDEIVEVEATEVVKKKEVVEAKAVVEKKVTASNKLTVVDFKDDVIKFKLNSSNESAALNKQVKSIAEKLKNSPSTKITLGGYTDKSGSAAFNKTLSIQRAKWVKDQLVGKYGISNDRIIVIGHGDKGTDLEFDPNNRKVEVIEVM